MVRYRAFSRSSHAFREIGSCDLYSQHGLGIIIMDVARFGAAIDWILRPFRSRSCSRYHFPDRVARRLVRDVIAGLSHLAKHNISHRDMKGDNIFLDGQGRFVIGDLGHVLVLPDKKVDELLVLKTAFSSGGTGKMVGDYKVKNIGTPLFNPPELRRGVEVEHAVYDPEKVDVWAIGVFIFSLLASTCLWSFQGIDHELLDDDLFISRPQVLRHF